MHEHVPYLLEEHFVEKITQVENID